MEAATEYAAFTLDRNGHPSGRIHFATDGTSRCGKPVADPIRNLGDLGPEFVVTCTKCQGSK